MIVYNNRFTLTELEDMFPFEREIYVSLLINHIEEENETLEEEKRIMKQKKGKKKLFLENSSSSTSRLEDLKS